MKKTAIALIFCIILACLSACGSLDTSKEQKSGKEYGVLEYRTTMQYHEDFKILQLTDLHLGIESDLATQLGIVEKSIKESDPDLIILTGDNFMYATKSISYQLISTLNRLCRELTEAHPDRLTKFALTYGNHDNQGDYPRYYTNSVIKEFTCEDGKEIEEGKYAAFVDYEDDNLFGLTNYYIDLVDDRKKSPDTVDVKYRLHIIDSNTYYSLGMKYGYDVIHTEQLLHAQKIYEGATKDKDYIGMAFFHIPFEEYDEVRLQFLNSDNPDKIGQGEFGENAFFPYTNNGSYSTLRKSNIVSFFVGHDHVNYGDFIYNEASDKIEDKAILSYGVKATNQLYHERDRIGYKEITLKDNLTKEEFISIENIKENFKNITTGYGYYEE
jgi:predicted MPP superfamily phosphohydrolase